MELTRIKKEVDIVDYIENRIEEQQSYANKNFLLHSERNAYMNGILKACVETLSEHIKRNKK